MQYFDKNGVEIKAGMTIRMEDGDMYVSFWHGGDDWFMLNGDEFDQYLSEQKMGGFE